MRLIRLALVITAVSFHWAAQANPAVNNSVSGTVSATTAATQVVGSATPHLDKVGLEQVALNQVSLNAVRGGEAHGSARTTSAAAMNEASMPSGWLMALVTVLLIGHQLRRKHRF